MAKPLDQEYDQMTKTASPPSKKVRNCLLAFLIGGAICCLGQLFSTLYENLGLNEDEVKAAIPITLIIQTAILTGLGLFGNLAKYGGAGTAVPITGFANSVVSPAMEFQTEGRILGTGAKMFTLAGPVITYGCSLAAIYGFIYYFFIR